MRPVTEVATLAAAEWRPVSLRPVAKVTARSTAESRSGTLWSVTEVTPLAAAEWRPVSLRPVAEVPPRPCFVATAELAAGAALSRRLAAGEITPWRTEIAPWAALVAVIPPVAELPARGEASFAGIVLRLATGLFAQQGLHFSLEFGQRGRALFFIPCRRTKGRSGPAEVALLARHPHLRSARRLRGDERQHGQSFRAAVLHGVIHARRDDEGVMESKLIHLGNGADHGVAFDDDVEVVGDVIGLALLGLARLQAEKLRGQTGAVDHVDADWLLAQKVTRLLEAQYFHFGFFLAGRGSPYPLAAGEGFGTLAKDARIVSIRLFSAAVLATRSAFLIATAVDRP